MSRLLLAFFVILSSSLVIAEKALAADQVYIQVRNLGSPQRPVFRMKVYLNQKARFNFQVSVGRSGQGSEMTPEGRFHPTPGRLYEWWQSGQSNTSWFYDDGDPMPHSIFFYNGFAIHGSMGIVDGTPRSHGCIRLDPDDARALFKLVKPIVDRDGVKSVTIDIRNTQDPRLF